MHFTLHKEVFKNLFPLTWIYCCKKFCLRFERHQQFLFCLWYCSDYMVPGQSKSLVIPHKSSSPAALKDCSTLTALPHVDLASWQREGRLLAPCWSSCLTFATFMSLCQVRPLWREAFTIPRSGHLNWSVIINWTQQGSVWSCMMTTIQIL